MLRVAIRPRQWASMDRLLDTNLVEHRILATLDASSAERFSTITAGTLLMCGTKSPAIISQQLLAELADVIPNVAVATLSGLDHVAPQHHPDQIAAAILSNPIPPSLPPHQPHHHDKRDKHPRSSSNSAPLNNAERK